MKKVRWLILAVLLFGCGGGGGGGSSSSSSSPPPTASAGGIWTGTAYSNVTKANMPITGIIAENNRANFVSVSEGVVSPALASSALADSGRHPISGTPFLRGQRLQLLRDYGPAARIKTEKDQFGRIFALNELNLQKTFYAYNFATQAYYQTTATCRSATVQSSGYYLNIYVEDAEWARAPSEFTAALLSSLSSEYSNNIVPKETTYFGTPPTGDFTILLMDIKDSGGTTFVSGYFDSLNEITAANSNQRHMIYMDSKEGTPGTTSFFGTFAHEFNHFIHNSYDSLEETWVEEGMAGLARVVCGYGPQPSHVNAFGLTPATSLIIWADTLENYGASLLFMLYLEEQYGGANITKAVIANTGTGIVGINSALFSKGYSVTVNDILKNWVVANYLNNSSLSAGIYGYQANDFSNPNITNSPGKIQVSTTVSTYPASGNGTVNQYAANYVRFSSLGGTFDTFVLIVYNLDQNGTSSYTYTGRLGSLILNLTGMSSTQGMEGVQQGSSNPTPAVVTNLSASNIINTNSGGYSSGTQFSQYAGTVSMSGMTLSGQATAYAPLGSTFLDGSHVGPLTISATVNPRVSISGTYSGVGDNGTISLTYDSHYDQPSSLATIQGTWRINNDAALGTVQYVISSTGAVTGSTGTGCVITGNVSIINPAYNAYQLNASLSNCGTANGAYSGLATLTDTSTQNDTMISGISNASTSIIGAFRRQAVTPPSTNLIGTYFMTGFTVNYSNGATLTDHSSSVTSWSGTMKVGSTFLTQSIVLNNVPITLTGTASITWINSTSGVAHVTDQSGTHDVSFTTSGYNLTTYSGVVQSSTPGITFQEWDYWVKVSDSLSPEILGDEEKRENQKPKTKAFWIGEIFNP